MNNDNSLLMPVNDLNGYEANNDNEISLNMSWDNIFEPDITSASEGGETAGDALIKCINKFGYIDLKYISDITKKDYEELIAELGDSIYQNPSAYTGDKYSGWEMSDEYLSGNIRTKLKLAKEASKVYPGLFDKNIQSLKAVMPAAIPFTDIYVTLGSPWIPTHIIEDFLSYAGEVKPWMLLDINVFHDHITGSWDVSIPNNGALFYFDMVFEGKYGTKRKTARKILLNTLNMQPVTVMDKVDSDITKSGKKSILNAEETAYAQEKQRKLISDFQKWIWSDARRIKELTTIYDEKYSCIKTRKYNGEFLTFPGLSSEIRLYHYQKNAIARILFSQNTLLAHEVGSGKTYIMIVAGMELRRLRLGNREEKLLYVVPNNIIGQWKNIFQQLYPKADILCVDASSFTSKKKQSTLKKIKDNNYDAILMTSSCFERIPISGKFQKRILIDKIQRTYRSIGSDGIGNDDTNALEKYRSSLINKRSKIIKDRENPEEIYFDDLGITRLFVDEAHNYKNVPIKTKIKHVMGINSNGSARCEDMLEKICVLHSMNDGGGIVFATGTPITNSITDAFIMQKYLQPAELDLLGIGNFDSWVGMFAEMQSNFEIDVDTNNYRMATRFSKFHNIPELTSILANVTDFHEMDKTSGIPEHDGYKDVIVLRTKAFSAYLMEISERADRIRSGRVRRTDDNMLKLTVDGRRAALDLRLVCKDQKFTAMSKVFMCAENVNNIYKTTKGKRSTQIVFCDTSTPGKTFNIYSDLKELLIKMGVDKSEIAFVHDANTEIKRERLFEDVRRGNIRVLIGSTFKLGLGVNVQNKLIALHHLDIPWRPADMVQREGRILRQGNENPQVMLFRYITEGSFDAYSWQLLETKQRFICDILSGISDSRNGADVDDTVLNYAEVKALAIGNPLIKTRVETVNELSKYKILQSKLITKRHEYMRIKDELPLVISKKTEHLEKLAKDSKKYSASRVEISADDRRKINELIVNISHREEPAEKDRFLFNYQGFELIFPKESCSRYCYLLIKNKGEYTVKLGLNSKQFLYQIDKTLNALENDYKKLKASIEQDKERLQYIKKELDNSDSYEYKIGLLREKLDNIDRKLGLYEELNNG